jgi:hypothetical protein
LQEKRAAKREKRNKRKKEQKKVRVRKKREKKHDIPVLKGQSHEKVGE